jgi:hypothetical protein
MRPRLTAQVEPRALHLSYRCSIIVLTVQFMHSICTNTKRDPQCTAFAVISSVRLPLEMSRDMSSGKISQFITSKRSVNHHS